MEQQLPDEVLEQAEEALGQVAAYVKGGDIAAADMKGKPTLFALVGLTAVLALIAYIMSEIGNYYEIKRNWSHYQCQPSIAPFAKFYGYDPTETMNFCIGQAVKQHAGGVITPIYKGIEEVSSVVGGAYDKVKAIESGVGGLIKGFDSFVTNFTNSFRLIGVRIRMSIIAMKDIFSRVFGIFIAFTYAGIAALTFGENLVCNPLTTFIGTIAGVDICCFAPETRVRMADGSTQTIPTIRLGDALAGGARVVSLYTFDGAAGCAGMVSVRGVHVSGNHYLRGPAGAWVRADAHPESQPVPHRPLIWCLGTTTNTIPVVAPDGSDWTYTDYEESSDPDVIAAAQAAAETALNGHTVPPGPTVADYSLGLHPRALLKLADGTWQPLMLIRPGTLLVGGAQVIGVVSEICESVCTEQGMSAAQLVWHEGRWVRAGTIWPTSAVKQILRHVLVAGSGTLHMFYEGNVWNVRDYSEAGEAAEAPYVAKLTGGGGT
jgi:hypothetical protein